MISTGTNVGSGIANIAEGYDQNGQLMPQMDHMKAISAAGYIKSNVSDMLLYMKFNMNEKLNNPVEVSHLPTFRNTDEGGNDIGLLWFVKDSGNQPKKIIHAGGSFGTTSYCLIIPGQKSNHLPNQ